jgi:hypothetical protein
MLSTSRSLARSRDEAFDIFQYSGFVFGSRIFSLLQAGEPLKPHIQDGLCLDGGQIELR